MLRSAAGALLLLAAAPAGAQAYGEDSALPRIDCDRTCLEGFAKSYVAALAAKDPSRAPFAKDIRFTENSVEMPVGEGLWGTVTKVDPADGMIPADTETANVAWFGHAWENGNLVFLAVRLHVNRAHQIDEAETVISRKTGMPATFSLQQVIPGWVEGIPLVGVGETARLWIPQELAYPNGGGPQGMLVFDVEMIAINPQ